MHVLENTHTVSVMGKLDQADQITRNSSYSGHLLFKKKKRLTLQSLCCAGTAAKAVCSPPSSPVTCNAQAEERGSRLVGPKQVGSDACVWCSRPVQAWKLWLEVSQRAGMCYEYSRAGTVVSLSLSVQREAHEIFSSSVICECSIGVSSCASTVLYCLSLVLRAAVASFLLRLAGKQTPPPSPRRRLSLNRRFASSCLYHKVSTCAISADVLLAARMLAVCGPACLHLSLVSIVCHSRSRPGFHFLNINKLEQRFLSAKLYAPTTPHFRKSL